MAEYLLNIEVKDVRNLEMRNIYRRYVQARNEFEEQWAKENGISLELDPKAECGLQREDIASFAQNRMKADYHIDYRIGWYLFLQKNFSAARDMFLVAREKAKDENVDFFQADYSVAFSYYTELLSMTEDEQPQYKRYVAEYCGKVIRATLKKNSHDAIRFLKMAEKTLRKTLEL